MRITLEAIEKKLKAEEPEDCRCMYQGKFIVKKVRAINDNTQVQISKECNKCKRKKVSIMGWFETSL